MTIQIKVYSALFDHFDFKYADGKFYIDDKELTYDGTEFLCESFKDKL